MFFWIQRQFLLSMARVQVLLALLAIVAVVAVPTAALYEEEKKVWVWPKPSSLKTGNGSLWLEEYTFSIKTTKDSYTHDILKEAMKRYSKVLETNKGVRTFPTEFLSLKAHLTILNLD